MLKLFHLKEVNLSSTLLNIFKLFNISYLSMSLQELKLKEKKELSNATDNFSPANKIGEGGFGSVYMVI